MSSANTLLRQTGFKSELKREDKRREYPSGLRKDYEKYGWDAFCFEVLEKVEPSKLAERKKHWMGKMLKENKKLYNKVIG